MKAKYTCKECGSKEFISQPNQYDVYISNKNKIVFLRKHHIDEIIKLYCRECSKELFFNVNDIDN